MDPHGVYRIQISFTLSILIRARNFLKDEKCKSWRGVLDAYGISLKGDPDHKNKGLSPLLLLW
jgi:hypothetical protein